MANDLTREEVLAFCRACDWAHEAWSVHRGFQDHLPENSDFVRKHVYFLNRLSIITQEYSLLQIAKLHDRADQFGKVNLSINFIVERGTWDDETRATLDQMRHELGKLPTRLSDARDKILAHHDREVAVASAVLGGFPEGMDDVYFETLQAFVNLVHNKCIGGPYLFGHFAKLDTELFVEALSPLPNKAPDQALQPTASAARGKRRG